jgi:hypothetical protein
MNQIKYTSLLSFLLLALGFIMPLTIFAQGGATTANITGNVSDENGAVISGAEITAKNSETGMIRSTSSGEDGAFIIVQLPPGMYEVTVKAEGFKINTLRFELVLGTNALLNAKLLLGSTDEIIVVKGDSVAEETKTESSTNIDRDRIDGLPINRRNFLDFTLTTARAVKDRIPAQGASATSGLSFNGQPARANNITIDGLENNDNGTGSVRTTFSQEAVQEFQVVSDGYSAEFGRALGGVVNIVTKGGSNELHGSLFFLNRNDTISARDVFAPFAPDYRQYQFGTTVSGPIKKDKIFYFASFERLSIHQNNFVTISDQTVKSARDQGYNLANGPVPFALDNTSFLARADVRLSAKDTFFVRYNFGGTYNGALEPFGGLIGASNGGIQMLKDNSLGINNTYINAGLNLVNETRFLYGRRNQDIDPIDSGPQVRIEAPEGLVTFGRSTLLPQPREERIYQVVDNVSLTRGRENIKFGVDYSTVHFPDDGNTKLPLFGQGLALFLPIDFGALANNPGLPTFTGAQAFDPKLRTPAEIGFLAFLASALPVQFPGFPQNVPLASLPLPFAFAQGFGNPDLKIGETQFAAFVQDDIKINPNLLLKLGLRYDINRVTLVPDGSGNFSPRVAIAYHPVRFSKLNAHASYGIFFGAPLFGLSSVVQLTTATDQEKVPVIPFPFSILTYALPGHHLPAGSSLGASIPPGVAFTTQLSTVFTNDPHEKNSYTEQVNVGIDYAINTNTVVSVTYDYVRGIKLLSQRDINPVVHPVPGNPLASQLTGRVFPNQGQTFEFESGFDSYYNALTFTINRRFSNKFSLLAHYTFSKAIDDFIDIRFDQQETVDSLVPRAERGLSLQDLRGRFVLTGIWNLDYVKNRFLRGFQLSSITELESGRPYNLLAGEDLNMSGDNPPGDRPIVNGVSLPRNAGVTPGFANVDMRLSRSITFKERYHFQFVAEVFNLFNRVNISDLNRIFPPDAQGNFQLPPQKNGRFIATPDRFIGAFSPRQFQLGIRANF